jgi:hypothetical protein
VRYLAFSAVGLAGCGGGGSMPVSGPVLPAPPWVAGKFFGYFGDFDGQMVATANHVNLAWIWAWKSTPEKRLNEARAAQVPFVVVGLPWAFAANDET